MDEGTRNQIILAAVQAAGPVGESGADWQGKVADAASRITAMLSEKSPISRSMEAISNSKMFHATITRLQKEKKSTRVLVTLATRKSERNPDGIEVARTERLDNGGLAMANRLNELKGHRVMLWVELQPMSGSDQKVRVVSHVEDLGVDESLDSDVAA